MGTNLMRPLLGFHHACQKHHELFLHHLTRAGCCDPEEMDAVRRSLFVWISRNHPLLVLECFNRAHCLGCEIDEVEPLIPDLIRQIVHERCRRYFAGQPNFTRRDPVQAGPGFGLHLPARARNNDATL